MGDRDAEGLKTHNHCWACNFGLFSCSICGPFNPDETEDDRQSRSIASIPPDPPPMASATHEPKANEDEAIAEAWAKIVKYLDEGLKWRDESLPKAILHSQLNDFAFKHRHEILSALSDRQMLVEALEPFAKAADAIDKECPGENDEAVNTSTGPEVYCYGEWEKTPECFDLTHYHFRRARAALVKAKGA